MSALVATALMLSLAQQASGSSAVLPKGWRLEASTGNLVHETTGVQFPEAQGGMTRGDVLTVDDKGENVAINYERPDHRLWLTVYIYPKDFGGAPDPRKHFDQLLREVAAWRKGSLEKAVERPVQLGNQERAGFVAFFRYRDRAQPVGSLLFLIPVGDRFVKVRATRVVDHGDDALDEALQAALSVLRSIQL
jgi:hypothetical protein